jgi:hypothetical protein
MWVSDQIHASTTSPPRGMVPWFSLKGRVGGPESLSGYFGEEINRLFLSGVEPQFLGRPTRSVVTILTTPSRLSDITYIALTKRVRFKGIIERPHDKTVLTECIHTL